MLFRHMAAVSKSVGASAVSADAALLHMAAVSGAVGTAAVSAVSDDDTFHAHGYYFWCYCFSCTCQLFLVLMVLLLFLHMTAVPCAPCWWCGWEKN